jgi:Mn2+/Fe2+ NRAMP family transporter
MAAVQEICDRTANVTGKSLGELLVARFRTRPARFGIGLLLAALIIANTLNIAADLAAVGAGMELLHAGPAPVWAIVAGAAVTVLLTTGSFGTISRVFKLLCIPLATYLVLAVVVRPDWAAVARSAVIPHIELRSGFIAILVAFLGTTISPYLFVWQTVHRVEDLRGKPEGGPRAVPLDEEPPAARRFRLRAARVDVVGGMLLSNLVMFAIVLGTAATLGKHGHRTILSAADAAAALRPVAGHFAELVFAFGFIGTGMLAIPVLAGAGAAGMAGLLGRRWGFSRSPRQAPVFYGLVVAGTVLGTLMNLFSTNTIGLLVAVAVINGVVAAPFLVLVMLVAGDRTIMREHCTGPLARIAGWTTAGLMTLAAIATFFTLQ